MCRSLSLLPTHTHTHTHTLCNHPPQDIACRSLQGAKLTTASQLSVWQQLLLLETADLVAHSSGTIIIVFVEYFGLSDGNFEDVK